MKKGFSIKDQIYDAIKLAHKVADKNTSIKEYIDEGISGEFLDRPALTRLREDVRAGHISVAICLDPDRLSRKLMNQLIVTEEIEKHAKLLFVNGEYKNTPEGNLFYQMRGAISEFEKAKINERMSRGRREKARQGRVVRNYNIYGYDYDTENEKLVANKYEAAVVKMIFDLFTGRHKDIKVQGINGIAKYLTEQEIPTKKNTGVWHRQVVRQILYNRTYIGEFYQNRWNCEGMLGNKFKKSEEDKISVSERPKEDWILIECPTIVEKDVFEYSQKLLKESRRRWAGKSKNNYLLSGLVRCDLCGNTMVGRRGKNWGKYIFEYVDIKNTAGSKFRGCGKKVKIEELDKCVWNTVLDWLNKQDAVEDEEEENNASFEKAELERIEKRLIEIGKGRQNLINFIAMSNDLDVSGIKNVNDKLKELKDEEESLLTKRDELVPDIDNLKHLKYKKNLIKEASNYYLAKSPGEITFEDKKELIRLLIREVRVGDEEVKVFGI